jgi:hypothetical protein
MHALQAEGRAEDAAAVSRQFDANWQNADSKLDIAEL